MSYKNTPEKFWARVDKSKDCWEWQGSCNNTGYGTVGWHGKVYVTHRVAAYLSGLVRTLSRPSSAASKEHVLHKCDNRKCCNPEHFFIGTYSDNQLDAYKKNRRVQPKGECHANAKLTNEQAESIRRIYSEGIKTQMQIAKEFKVSQRVIHLITANKTYVSNARY